MHYGVVADGSEPTLVLTTLSADGEAVYVDFAIDTGFTDEITLPPDIIDQLGLPFNRDVQLFMADGTVYVGTVHTGWVMWHDRVREIDLVSVDANPLVGMRLLAGSNLSIDAEPGGAVTITELPVR